MLKIFTFSPYLTLFFATLFQLIIVIGFILAPKNYAPTTKIKRIEYNVFMQLGFGLYFLFGVFFIDTAIFWLIGQWTWADWMFQLPAVILLLIIGVQYLIGAWLINPTKFDLIYFGFSIPLMLFLIHFMTGYIITNLRLALGIVLGVIILMVLFYTVVKSKMTLSERTPPKYKWNYTKQYQKIFNRKYNVILYVFLTAESFCKILGTSLLIEFSVLFGIILVIIILILCDRLWRLMQEKGQQAGVPDKNN